ncbi:MAG: hypothetical protein JWQ62_847 [Lacunisphaera sp.]|nr:hypothetical protein [Lacunisphaera sp.]
MNALRLVDDCFPGALAGNPGEVNRGRLSPVPLPHRVLTELLAWNEEMISQLRAERGDDSAPGFLTTLIAQHEKTVALLRVELAGRND